MNKLTFFWGLPLLVLVACNPFAGNSDQRATEQAHSTARVQTAIYAGTQAGTVVALQSTADNASIMATQLAQLERERQFLEATIQAIQTFGVTPQPRLTAAPSPVETAGEVPSANFINLHTATGIDESTGCALDDHGRFSVNDKQIFFTFVAQNLKAQTSLQTRWRWENELRYESEAWIPEQDYDEVCVYFWLEPSYTSFDPGTWRVELLVDGETMAEVPFQICAEGALC